VGPAKVGTAEILSSRYMWVSRLQLTSDQVKTNKVGSRFIKSTNKNMFDSRKKETGGGKAKRTGSVGAELTGVATSPTNADFSGKTGGGLRDG